MACLIWKAVDSKLRLTGTDRHLIRIMAREFRQRKELRRCENIWRRDSLLWRTLPWWKRVFASMRTRRMETFWWTGIRNMKMFGSSAVDLDTDSSTGPQWENMWRGVWGGGRQPNRDFRWRVRRRCREGRFTNDFSSWTQRAPAINE